jgi:hypothetical protein
VISVSEIKVMVSGKVGVGKSHVLAVIERALNEAYGESIQIVCEDTESERRSIGEDIREWQQPTVEKIVLTAYTAWHREEIVDVGDTPARDYFTEWTRGREESPFAAGALASFVEDKYPPLKPRYETLNGRVIRIDEAHPTAAKAAVAKLVESANVLHIEMFMPGDNHQMIGMGYLNDGKYALQCANLIKGIVFDMAFVEPYFGDQEKVTTFRNVEVQSAMSQNKDGVTSASIGFKVGKMNVVLRNKHDPNPLQFGIPLGVTEEG